MIYYLLHARHRFERSNVLNEESQYSIAEKYTPNAVYFFKHSARITRQLSINASNKSGRRKQGHQRGTFLF
jgi:hypothetical protein